MSRLAFQTLNLCVLALASALTGGTALAADQLLPPGKCPFTLGVTPSMQSQGVPFGTLQSVAHTYRAAEKKDALQVTYIQRTTDSRVVYAVRCSAADPAKWLARFGGDEATVCGKVNSFPDADRKANAYCSLTTNGPTRTLVTGTWSKDAKAEGMLKGQARFTVAQAGVGLLAARVSVTSADATQAKTLAEQLAATLAVAPKSN